MILSYSEVSDSRRVFELEIPAEEVAKTRLTIVRGFARRAALPGFRAGKVPESVVSQRFAHEIQERLLEELIPKALSSAIEEKGLQPIGQPRIEDLKIAEGSPLAFRANVDVRPSIALPDYRGIPVQDHAVEPSEEEVAGSLLRIREGNSEFLPIEGRTARDGDFAIADIASRFVEAAGPVLVDPSGQSLAEESAGEWQRDEKLTLEVGHASSMAEINDALRGAAPGETRRFRKTFAADFQNAHYAGKTVDYEVTLTALKEKRVPSLDDDFARQVAGVESVAELEGRVRDGLRAEKESARRQKLQKEILEDLRARVDFTAPEVLVDAEVESALEQYASYLSSQGMDAKEADWDKLAREARPSAERRVKEYLILDEVARREGLEVTETEVDAEIKSSAARRGADYNKLREQLEAGGRIRSVREEIRLQKASTWLIEHADLKK